MESLMINFMYWHNSNTGSNRWTHQYRSIECLWSEWNWRRRRSSRITMKKEHNDTLKNERIHALLLFYEINLYMRLQRRNPCVCVNQRNVSRSLLWKKERERRTKNKKKRKKVFDDELARGDECLWISFSFLRAALSNALVRSWVWTFLNFNSTSIIGMTRSYK